MPQQLPVPKITAEQQVQNQLTAAYEAATPEDKANVQALVRDAIGASPSTRILDIPPGMGAILFHDHNTQNREWQYTLTQEYARQMRNGDWDFTPAGIGFSTTGPMIDGQHRMAAVALGTVTLPFTVVLGVNLRAVEVIDTGRRRQASAALHILQHRDMPDAKVKSDIITKSDTYLSKATSKPKQFLDYRAIGRAVAAQDTLLNSAIEIAERAALLISRPTLKRIEAQVAAYVLLVSGWPESIVEGHLRHLQTGQDIGENSPFFVGARILDSEPKGEKFTLTEKLGLTVKIFQLAEQGVKAVPRKNLKEAMDTVPNPDYAPTVTV